VQFYAPYAQNRRSNAAVRSVPRKRGAERTALREKPTPQSLPKQLPLRLLTKKQGGASETPSRRSNKSSPTFSSRDGVSPRRSTRRTPRGQNAGLRIRYVPYEESA